MFVDASVIVAILNKEPGWEELEKQLSAARRPVYVSPLVRFEAVHGLARAAAENIKQNTKATPDIIALVRGLVDDFATEIAAQDIMISVDIGNGAIDASMKYGKALGHKADLNFGDCFAYACAKANRLALLYKGNDFSLTDLA
jgi:ribonuclease VapC